MSDERRPDDRAGRIGPIHHVAVVVHSIHASLPRYAGLFGLVPAVAPRVIAGQGVKVCLLPTGPPPAAQLELIEPVDPGTGVARFLAARGEGLHHVCFGTPNIEAELGHLASSGAELIDPLPRPGAEGRVAFVHPRTLDGVLWELLEPEAGS